jgi:hypothetical protein
MKIFNKGSGWESKVNFVDDNNVCLGYDTNRFCCEHADWFIADQPMEHIIEEDGTPDDLAGWNFDTAYFKEVDYIEGGNDSYKYNELEDGGMVIFRIVKGDEEKFIHLFNCHNGYYGHGFEFAVGQEVIHTSSI